MHLFAAGGFPLHRTTERDIENRLRKADYSQCSEERCRDVSDMSSVRMMYRQELCRQAPDGFHHVSARIGSPGNHVRRVMEDCMARLGCTPGAGPRFEIDASGTVVTARDETGAHLPWETLLAVCCKDQWESGGEVSLPYGAPGYLDDLAAACGKRAHRYLESPVGEEDGPARESGKKQQWVRDALFLTVRLLSIMDRRHCTLRALVQELPHVEIYRSEVGGGLSPSGLYELFGSAAETPSSPGEGIVLRRGGGRVLITPSRTGSKFRVLAESADMEAAREICLDVCARMRSAGAGEASGAHALDSGTESEYNK